MFKKLDKKAFSHVEAFIILVVFIIIGAVGYMVYNKNTSHAGGLNYQKVAVLNFSKHPFTVYACVQNTNMLNYYVNVPVRAGKSAGFNPLVLLNMNNKTVSQSANWVTGSVSTLTSLRPVTHSNSYFQVGIEGYELVNGKSKLTIVWMNNYVVSELKNCNPSGSSSGSSGNKTSVTFTVTSSYKLSSSGNTGCTGVISLQANPSTNTTQGYNYSWSLSPDPGSASGQSVDIPVITQNTGRTESASLVVLDKNNKSVYQGTTNINIPSCSLTSVTSTTGTNYVSGAVTSTGSKVGFQRVVSVATDKLGHVWVIDDASHNIDVFNQKDGKLVAQFNFKNSDATYPVKIVSDSNGNIWTSNALNSAAVLVEFNPSTMKELKSFPETYFNTPNHDIGSFGFEYMQDGLSSDSLGNVWALSGSSQQDRTVTKLNGVSGIVTNYPISSLSLNTKSVDTGNTYIDSSNTIWVRYDDDSLYQLDNQGKLIYQGYTFINNLLTNTCYNNACNSIANGQNNLMWIFKTDLTTPRSGGGYNFTQSVISVDKNGNTVKQTPIPSSQLPSSQTYGSLTLDSNGKIWAVNGTNNVLEMDPTTGTILSTIN